MANCWVSLFTFTVYFLSGLYHKNPTILLMESTLSALAFFLLVYFLRWCISYCQKDIDNLESKNNEGKESGESLTSNQVAESIQHL
ncbi:hypothetical protein [Bacillus sp. 2205SS5-2]|uniref:hypothetical protein n=1 Tax=Bacillus sp. 2205SS5-2 TaxID=3109031 RepID=UPI003004827C